MVYKFLNLTSILLVATTSVKRAFVVMKFVKSWLSNKMNCQWLNDCLITFREKDVLKTINNIDRVRKI
jgi:hypothetical protein